MTRKYLGYKEEGDLACFGNFDEMGTLIGEDFAPASEEQRRGPVYDELFIPGFSPGPLPTDGDSEDEDPELAESVEALFKQ